MESQRKLFFCAWARGGVLGGVATGVAVAGCAAVHGLQRTYQRALLAALQDACGRVYMSVNANDDV